MYEIRLGYIRSFEQIYLVLFLILLIVTFANILLYRRLRLYGYRGLTTGLNKDIKTRIYLYGVLTLCLSCWIFFGEDRSMSLRCYKQKTACEYFRSTHFNKLMQRSGIYDLSRIKTVSVTYRRNWLTDSFYTLTPVSDQTSVELPVRFDSKREAEKEADKFNAFLSGETDHYLYKKEPLSSETLKSRILIPLPLLIIFLQLRIFAELIVKTYGLKNKS